MKAAVIHAFGEIPQYTHFPDPIADERNKLIKVSAAVLENFDKLTVSGTHYSSKKLFPHFPAVVGTDGVGTTQDGQLVAFGNITAPYGAFAEKAIAGYTIPVPEDIDPAKAAAIPPSALTSLLPLKYSAKLSKGATVLINGATGVSGKIAVQVAKMLGAGKIVGTGRNKQSLQFIKSLGADEVVDLEQPDEALKDCFRQAGGTQGIDVVIDFLWGRPAQLLIESFIPDEAGFAKHEIRYLQIGEKAGSQVSLPGAALRTSGLQLMGVGKISAEILSEELNTIWNWIKEDRLYMDIECVPLSAIAPAWQRDDLAGKRLVIIP